MIGYSRAFARTPLRAGVSNFRALPLLRRNNSTQTPSDATTQSSDGEVFLSEKEQRERELAKMIAQEEAAAERAKQLKLWQEESISLISDLNKAPSNQVEDRLQKLQGDLNKLSQEKVKQLDEELEEFMLTHMNLPTSQTEQRPWIEQIEPQELQNLSDFNVSTKTAQVGIAAGFSGLKPTPEYKSYSPQELYVRQLHHARVSGTLGSQIKKVTPIQVKRGDMTIENLMAAGCHLGHATASWRPSTQPYIYGTYNGIHIIDLNKTISMLKNACEVIEGIARKGGVILYVGTLKNDTLKREIEDTAYKTKGYYVYKRWIPGMITNHVEVIKQITVPAKTNVDMGDNDISNGSQREVQKFIKPDLVVLLNPADNRNCLRECITSNVPTIGLCDTDMEPSLLTYPIPCNDDGVRSVSLMLRILSRAAEDGRRARIEAFEAYEQAKRDRKLELKKERRGVEGGEGQPGDVGVGVATA